jgi:Ca2+-binding RTX toxin-like protein
VNFIELTLLKAVWKLVIRNIDEIDRTASNVLVSDSEEGVFLEATSVIDILIGGNGDDTLTGNDLSDLIFGVGGNNLIEGGSGNDSLIGGQGSDSISGRDGDDLLIADLKVFDELRSANGFIFVNELNDEADDVSDDGDDVTDEADDVSDNMLMGGEGNDTLTGGRGNDTPIGDGGDRFLFGVSGNNSRESGEGNDTLLAGTGNDILIGGSGNNLLNGGSGDDTLTGGSGADVFVIIDRSTLGNHSEGGEVPGVWSFDQRSHFSDWPTFTMPFPESRSEFPSWEQNPSL